MHNIAFSDKCEAYYRSVCSQLPNLCPRLIPRPLWGISLAKLARLNLYEAETLCTGCSSIIKELALLWRGLKRGVCSVCGRRGFHVDEDWRYFLLRDGGIICDVSSLRDTRGVRGVAYLAKLRVLCEKCHLAKHLGYASVQGRLSEALKHLAEVNGVDMNIAIKVRSLVEVIWMILSGISDWSIVIGDIGLDTELRRSAENLLNIMYYKSLGQSEMESRRARSLLDYSKTTSQSGENT
jgi:hypothetical protein